MKRNIIWATGSYDTLGEYYRDREQITAIALQRMGKDSIQPRIMKGQEEQQQRTRKHGEVQTPAWLCCRMNEYLDAAWFERENVFNVQDRQTWVPVEGKIVFPKHKHNSWRQYVDSRRLEITCGEAPFISSRYDAATGESIPIERRIGLLDRKLRIVSENTDNEVEWLKWAIRAVQSVYGYEYQGDNLLIARMNGMDQAFRNQQSDVVGMIDDLVNRQEDLETVSNLALNLWQALSSGNLDDATAAEYAAQLQEILDLVNAADQYIGVGNELSSSIAQGMQEYGWEGDATTLASSLQTAIAAVMPQVGSDASAGVGQGMSEYDFSGDANTAADNLEGAYRGSLDSQSPAQRMVPLGNDVSAGVGQGMTQYSFMADSNTAASNLVSALSAALAAQAAAAANSAKGIGTAITSGIAAGIRSGQSAVIQAAVTAARSALAAAKTALEIHSPSGVFREEVGLMAMKGMGEGFLKGEEEQAKIIRNAARYLTEEAQGGIIAGNTHNDNRQTVHQQSNVNLTGNSFYVRSDQDIHDLAVEIATLTRTQQRGRGLRMA